MHSHLVSKDEAYSSMRVLLQCQNPVTTRGFWLSLVAFLMLGCAVPSARAQVSASIKGIITDASRATVPSATVTVRNEETGASRATVSDGTGGYLVLALPVSLYEVRVSKSGFQDSTRSGIQLNVGQEAEIDVQLQVSGVKSSVTVSEDAPMVSTSTSDISGLVDAKGISSSFR